MILKRVFFLVATLGVDLFPASVVEGCQRACSGTRDDPCRRLLRSVQLLLGNKECSEQYYSLSWFTDYHIYLVASPSTDVPDGGNYDCGQSYVFHDTNYGKEFEILPLRDVSSSLANFEEDSLALGDFMLRDLTDAFERAEEGAGGVANENYDIVTNNCATFAMNMIGQLGMIVDEPIMAYTSRRLTTNAEGRIAKMLRNSPNLGLLGISEPDEFDDDILLDLLVRHYVQEKYREYDDTDFLWRPLVESYLQSFEESSDSDFRGEPSFAHRRMQDPPPEDMRRRILSSVNYNGMRKRCGEAHYHTMLAVADASISVCVVPDEEQPLSAALKSCKALEFDSFSPSKKGVKIANCFDEFSPDSLHRIGKFTLNKVLDAFEGGTNTTESYDIVTNNCATLAMQMLCSLKGPIGKDVLQFITERLSANEKSIVTIVNLIEHSPHRDLLTSDGRDKQALIHDLVKHYHHTHGKCNVMGTAV